MTTNELRQALLASVADTGVVVPTEQQLETAISETPSGTPFAQLVANALDQAAEQPDEDETEPTATSQIVKKTIRLNGKQFGPKRQAKLERTLDTTSLPLVVMALSQIVAERAAVMSVTPGLKRTAGKWAKAAEDLAAFAARNSIKSLA